MTQTKSTSPENPIIRNLKRIGPVKSIFPIKKPKKNFTKNIKVHLSETIQSYVIPAEAGRAIPKPTIIIVNPTLSRIPK